MLVLLEFMLILMSTPELEYAEVILMFISWALEERLVLMDLLLIPQLEGQNVWLCRSKIVIFMFYVFKCKYKVSKNIVNCLSVLYTLPPKMTVGHGPWIFYGNTPKSGLRIVVCYLDIFINSIKNLL